MSRRTVTIDPTIDTLVNIIRGLSLLVGLNYNYTEVVNGLAYYGICYWLRIDHKKAVEMAPQIISTNLKLEGIQDELRDKWVNTVLPKSESVSR